LRALIAERRVAASDAAEWPSPLPDLPQALDDYAAQLTAQPWLDSWPLAMRDVRVAEDEAGTHWLIDTSSPAGLPLSEATAERAAPLSLTGAIQAFGVWDGRRFDLHLAETPLGRWQSS
jgi:hypothetical protein